MTASARWRGGASVSATQLTVDFHRSNILVDGAGHCLLADLGLGCHAGVDAFVWHTRIPGAGAAPGQDVREERGPVGARVSHI